MKQSLRTSLIVIALFIALLPDMAAALEYRTIAATKAILYDTPSTQGKKLYVIGQGYPVEVIVNLADWIKVRDNQGGLSWIEAKQLAAVTKHTVLVTLSQAEIRQAADASATVLARLEKDVVLDLVETSKNGWIKVKHRDGVTGYMLASSVWGS